jgi:hypothetical protein
MTRTIAAAVFALLAFTVPAALCYNENKEGKI